MQKVLDYFGFGWLRPGKSVEQYPTNLNEHSLYNKNYRRTLAFNEVELLCGNKTIV